MSGAVYRVKTAAHDPIPSAVRRVGDLSLHIDRPKGTQKTWELPDGPLTKTYPTDYGYLPGHTGEDGEPLDFFVGSDAEKGWHGSFHKKKHEFGPDGQRTGHKLPDETKYFAGLTPEEHAQVLQMFDGPSGLVSNHRFFGSMPGLQGALSRHRDPVAKHAAHKKKTFLGYDFKIDRPKGFVKKWDSGKEFTYPCDYGYFPQHLGEDGEGLDAFVGDDPDGAFESFLKLKPDDDGKMVPDETKFLLGVSAADKAKIYALYGKEVSERKTYPDIEAAMKAADKFKGKARFAKKAEDLDRLRADVESLLAGRVHPADVALTHAAPPDNERARNRVMGAMHAAQLLGLHKLSHRANAFGKVYPDGLVHDHDHEFDASADFWSKK